MQMTRQRSYKHYKKGTFLSLPHDVMDHHDFLSLSPKACKLLLDLGRQYNGFNNGDLCAAFSIMRKRGWNSNAQLQKAKKELLNKNLIVLTRQGGRRKNMPCLYALAWLDIDECKNKLDYGISKTRPRSFKKNF
jgi:hypothetical protein